MKKTVLSAIGIFILLISANSYPTETFRFVVISDTHNTLGSVNPKRAAAAIKSMNPEIILHAGDFTCCMSGQPNNLFKFDEYRFLAGIPVFPTTGNHDYDGNASAEYNSFWNTHKPSVPVNGEWAHSYSFDYKGFHFVALNWKNPNIIWLKNDLEKNAGKPTFIFSHLSALNTGCKPAFNKDLSRLAETNPDIKAVFSGHSHCYGKQEIKPGTYQVFVGTLSHDNKRDLKYKGKHTFVVVEIEGRNLKICPASVEDGILEGNCGITLHGARMPRLPWAMVGPTFLSGCLHSIKRLNGRFCPAIHNHNALSGFDCV